MQHIKVKEFYTVACVLVLIFLAVYSLLPNYFDGIISTVFSFPIKIDVAITSEFYILLGDCSL